MQVWSRAATGNNPNRLKRNETWPRDLSSILSKRKRPTRTGKLGLPPWRDGDGGKLR